MDLNKYYNKGLTGMANLGNTCFLNASMQVINHTYELNEFLDTPAFKKNVKVDTADGKMMTEWNDLRRVMWSGNGVVTPRKFVHSVRQIAHSKNRDLFTGFAQNDMPEFLLFIIDCLHNSLSRSVIMRISGNALNSRDVMATKCYDMLKTVYSKEYSEIMDMFYGIYVSEILTIDGKLSHTMKPEHFFMLDVPIVSNDGLLLTNLHDCINHYTLPEQMVGENAWFNEKTNKKEDVMKRLSFWNFPKILVIVLKRFSADGQHKNTSPIDFPIHNLDLSSYVRGYQPQSYIYDLYGICNHLGGTSGGHYTSFVKTAADVWIHFDDERTEVIENETALITPNAYCLFYRKK
jgi:ubiquitin carboxyl-terminal hydrolase 8